MSHGGRSCLTAFHAKTRWKSWQNALKKNFRKVRFLFALIHHGFFAMIFNLKASQQYLLLLFVRKRIYSRLIQLF